MQPRPQGPGDEVEESGGSRSRDGLANAAFSSVQAGSSAQQESREELTVLTW